MGEAPWQSQPRPPPKWGPIGAKLPLSGTRDTSSPMSDRKPGERKPPFRRPSGKPFDKGRDKGRPAGGHPAGRRPAWRDRESGPDGLVILYGWHTVTLALQNPERHIRKLLLT